MQLLNSKIRARKTALLAAITAVAIVAAYSNTLQVPFLFDDIPRILEERQIRNWWPPQEVMRNSNRPFAHYTFAINYAAHGYQVLGYHATNLAIHILSAWVFFGIVLRSLMRGSIDIPKRAIWMAFFAALFWCLHPLNTQAVTYIVQRLESMMGLFYLLTLYCFIRAQSSIRPTLWLLLSILACSVGMGCKEVMATAPILVLWYDRAFIASSWSELLRTRWRYYVGLASTWLVLVWAMMHYTVDYTSGGLVRVPGLNSWTYLLSQSTVIIHYLRLTVWPSGQCVYAAWPIAKSLIEVWPCFLFMTIWILVTLWCIWRKPRLGFLLGAFLVILAPTSSIVPIKDLMFEHRMYLPLTLLSAIAVVFFTAIAIPERRWGTKSFFMRFSFLIGIGVAFALGVVTYHRNSVYRSEISVWTDSVEKSPTNVKVWVGLGGLHAKAKSLEQARACFARALQLDPNCVSAHAQFAGLLIEQRDYAEAKVHLDAALLINPQDLEAISNMGHLLFDMGNFQDAVSFYQATLLARPDNVELRLSLAAALIQDGRFVEAIETCESMFRDKLITSQLHAVYAAALAGLNRNAEAIEQCERALRLDDRHANAHATLATLIANTEPALALKHMRQAWELQPKSFEFCSAYATMLLPHEPRNAIPVFEAALNLQPNHVDTLLKITVAWETIGEPANGIPYLERVVSVEPTWTQARTALDKLKASTVPTRD
ncbi:MAG: tetratricopeptide repeat protein [Pirellula sp.]